MAEDTAKPKRRIVKKVETVREKAEKAAEKNNNQPRKLHATKRRVGAPFRFIGRVFARLGRFKPFRIIGYIIVPPYFRNSWKELRQVTWPTWRDSLKLVSAVIIFAVIFGCLVALLDVGLDKLFREVLIK